jgi:phosphohistidine phosphatase
MRLCLVRHAIAVERGTKGFEDDALRPLTPAGRARMEEAARGLRTLFRPQLVLTSPLVRARETAAILTKAYDLPDARTCDALATGDHNQLLRALTDSEASEVMVVGHEPHISALLALLVAGNADALSATFKKGAAALLESGDDPRPGNFWLEWLIQPAALRRLAQSREA